MSALPQREIMTEQFKALLFELEDHSDFDQKKKIEEISKIMNKMDRTEFEALFTNEMLDEREKIIMEKKMHLESEFILFKLIGFYKIMKNVQSNCFCSPSLCQRIENMMFEEELKQEKKNEKLLVDLCECYLILYNFNAGDIFLSICVSCLMKVASNKEKDDETQKEVEMALFALSNISEKQLLQIELNLNTIIDIIKYHREHHNLTQLANQSAWHILIFKFQNEKSLESESVSWLHFLIDATKELELWSRNVNWKKKDIEEEEKEMFVITRWLETTWKYVFYYYDRKYKAENIAFMNSIASIYGAAKNCNKYICKWCVNLFHLLKERDESTMYILMKSGAAAYVLEEMHRLVLSEGSILYCLDIFSALCNMLRKRENDEPLNLQWERLKTFIIDRLEEEGYEDIMIGFQKMFHDLNKRYSQHFSEKPYEYFICF